MKKAKDHFQQYRDLLKPPKPGDIIKGKVIEKTKKSLFLDLENYKTGKISKEDLALSGESLSKIKIGEEISAKIIDLDDRSGFVKLSLKNAREDLIWKKLEDLGSRRGEISLKVAGANKGGLLFNVSGIQGFLPASQLSRENYPRIENPTPERVFEELKKFIGKEMKVRIIKTDPRGGKLILSQR